MVARAYGILCQQGASFGASTEETITDCENAKQGYATAGDYNNEARTTTDLAGIYFERGDLAQAGIDVAAHCRDGISADWRSIRSCGNFKQYR